MKKFNVLYYPYSTISDDTLKVAALWFDTVYIQKVHPKLEGDLNKLADFASEELNCYGNIDTWNQDALECLRNSSDPQIHLLMAAIKYRKFHAGIKILQDNNVLKTTDLGELSYVKTTLMDAMEKLDIADELRSQIDLNEINSIATPYGFGKKFVRPGEKIDSNTEKFNVFLAQLQFSYIASRRRELNLFTDGETQHTIMQGFYNYFGAAKDITDILEASISELDELSNKAFSQESKKDIKKSEKIGSQLGFHLLKNNLPNINLHSYEDILETRHHLNAELEDFREKMINLSLQITSEPFTESFESFVETKSKELNKVITNIENKIKNSTNKFLRSLITTLSLGSVDLVTQACNQTLLSSALSALTAKLAITTVKDFKDMRDDKKQILKENCDVTYLLKLKKNLKN